MCLKYIQYINYFLYLYYQRLNLTSNCNSNCSCDGIPYSPVCYLPTGTTYFSSCHAGCNSWNPKYKVILYII